ncbi:MAG TPA: carbamoyltransferase N-terminal domain-containing protein, partial [Burkholderiales bacterium]|nr:carbamoyltransferase N-terminal domain-containing protein [Burkholderiales bacterium]
MLTLGINAVFHDSAACLVRDGQLVAAAEEERYTRIKHAKRPLPFTTWELPFHAIDYCLAAAGIELSDLDYVAYSFNPGLVLGEHRHDATIALPLEPSAHEAPTDWLSPWEPLSLSYVVNAERQLIDGAPFHLRRRFKSAKTGRHWTWRFVDHHLAHEASAFLAAPFDEAAVMTLDGRGERASTCYGHFTGADYRRIGQVCVPHSLGLLYEDVTRYLGFLHSSDEYKVMALASYGKPVYIDQFREMVQLDGKGQYAIAPLRLVERFGPARERGSEFGERHFNIARSLQVMLEETVVDLARWLKHETGSENLCMAGGVALNCVMNARVRDAGIFRRVWVQPAAGDSGTAIGAALWTDWRARGRARSYRMDHAFLGPEYSESEIKALLDYAKLPYRRAEDIAEETAAILASDRIVGWFQGRMEFGPRALGGRSILASPLTAEIQHRLNAIKDREDFRPVAPVVLEEEAVKWFAGADVSPFMLFVFD